MTKLLILSPTPTHPTNAGNRARIRTWLEMCVAAGVDFHFVFFRQEPGDETAMANAWGADRCTFLDYELPRRIFTIPQRLRLRVARALHRPQVVPFGIDDWRCESLVQAVRKLAGLLNPSCVQIEYVFFSHLFECFEPSVFKILDTHDIMAGREQLFLKQGREPEWFYTTKRQEAIGINRADYVIAIQEQECLYFKGMSGKPVATVGHIVDLVRPRPPTTTDPTAVFIGSANKVNQDALSFLLEKIWPLVRASVPNARLEVLGSVCTSATADLPGVWLAGEIKDLSQAYNRAWLLACPLRFGTGLKIKSIEALGQGKALATTTSGCTGLENGQNKAFLRGDSAKEFADCCISILTDSKLRNELEQRAYEYAAAWNLNQRASFLSVITAAGLR